METKSIYTKEDLLRSLADMKAPRDRCVLVHASLRTVGAIEGGAATLLDALIEYFTAEGGLLCVPTHTWRNLKKEITLDLSDPSTCLGAFSDLAAADPRGIRSENPTHSMVVFGDRKRAEAFIYEDAFVKTPTAPESCYGKLDREGGFVLLLGVSHTKNTYLHAVAEILNMPNRMADTPLATKVRRLSGEVIPRELTLYHADFSPDVSWRFSKYETAFRYHGCITDGKIGDAPVQLCDARKMKETVALILSRSEGADPLENEIPLPPKWYCNR